MRVSYIGLLTLLLSCTDGKEVTVNVGSKAQT